MGLLSYFLGHYNHQITNITTTKNDILHKNYSGLFRQFFKGRPVDPSPCSACVPTSVIWFPDRSSSINVWLSCSAFAIASSCSRTWSRKRRAIILSFDSENLGNKYSIIWSSFDLIYRVIILQSPNESTSSKPNERRGRDGPPGLSSVVWNARIPQADPHQQHWQIPNSNNIERSLSQRTSEHWARARFCTLPQRHEATQIAAKIIKRFTSNLRRGNDC